MKPWLVNLNIKGAIYPPVSDEPIIGGFIIFKTQKGSHMGEITVRADEATLAATVSFVDAEGNVTPPDEVPTWEVGDPSVLTVTPAEDGMSATFEVGAPGVSSVTVTTRELHGGEGDPTDVVLSGLVTAVAGDTVSGSIEFTTG